MNRNDVIDVLTVVAAATRRTVGNADVDIWQEIIGDLDKARCLKAVRDHLADAPGVWLEPGHVRQRVRAAIRDELEREPDTARDARQKALEAKVAADVAELAAAKRIPAEEFKYKRRGPNKVLMVRCPWCKSGPNKPCVIPMTTQELSGGKVHDARVIAATQRAKS